MVNVAIGDSLTTTWRTVVFGLYQASVTIIMSAITRKAISVVERLFTTGVNRGADSAPIASWVGTATGTRRS